MTDSPKKKSLPAKIFAFLASFGVGVVVLSFLLLLTWLGTLEQTTASLYDVQRKYFDSLWLIHEWGPLKIPLPGVYLLLGILFVNMFCGGIIRIRKSLRNLGAVIAHFSILFLIVAGFVSYHYKIEGYLRLYEGQTSSLFTSYHNRAIEIAEVGKTDPVLRIREQEFEDCAGGKTRTFHHPSLPFEMTVGGYQKNSAARVAEMNPPQAGEEVVQDVYLQGQPAAKEAEADLAGAYLTLKDKAGASTRGMVWDLANAPLTYRAAGRTFAIRLTREAWELPFSVKLNRFTHEYHPGTVRPKVFESEVTKTEDGVTQNALIEMNKPLRRNGYTLFQASWGPEGWRPDQGRDKLFSVFAVVRNPSDSWPIYACVMAAIGMGIQFIFKLVQAIARNSRKGATS